MKARHLYFMILLLVFTVPWIAHAQFLVSIGGGGGTAGTPTPTPTATPTPPLPNGVSAPEFGSWTVQVNDNFNTDSSINTALWNGGPGGPGGGSNNYFPFCWPSNNCPNTSAPTGSIADCLGYAGLSPVDGTECNQVYEAANGKSGNTLVNGIGLETLSYQNFAGGGTYFNKQWAGLQSYGAIAIQPNSFIEWKGQLPTDVAGETDGEHTDYWCTNSARQYLGTNSLGAEVDIAEHVMGTSTANHQTQNLSIFDANTTLAASQLYSAPGTPDLTAGMHTYGMWWKYPTSGATAGQFLFYVDGNLISGSPFNLNSVNWYNPPSSQTYCFAGYMDPSYSYIGNNGAVVDSSTVDPGVPLKTQYFRYWQGGPSPTPTPTPTPGPGPVFVDRSETSFGNCNGTTAAETFTPNTTPTNGNVLVALISEFVGGFSSATPPSGWTSKGSYTNSNNDKVDVWTHTYSSGDTLPYTAGGGPNLCAVKVVVRDYSSATGPDAINGLGVSGSTSGCTIPALAATAHTNETYVGWMTSDSSGHSNWNIPSGWGDQTTDSTNGWSTLEGDFAVPTSGTVPAAQAGTLVTGNGNNACAGITIY